MKFKKMIAAVLAFMLTAAFFNVPAAAITSPSITMGAVVRSDGDLYYPGLTVSGSEIRTVLISFSAEVTSGDKIVLPDTPAGFTVSASSSTNDYAKRINVDSSVTSDAIQSYLRAVGYELGGETQSVQIVITNDNIEYDTFYNTDTQHYYQFISAPSDGVAWTTAYAAAKGMSYLGRSGYLATVTSVDEDVFLNSLSAGQTGWLGGTVLANSGSVTDKNGLTSGPLLYYSSFDVNNAVSSGWYWACGPEIGTEFYSVKSINDVSGADDEAKAAVADALTDDANPDAYYNWSRGNAYEPNNTVSDTGRDENCLTTLFLSERIGKHDTSFTWNDIAYNFIDQTNDYSAKGYFVEYGDWETGDSGSGDSTFASAGSTLSVKPVLTAGDVTRTTDTTGTVKFTSSEAGEYYYAIVAAGTTAPTIDTSATGTACIAGENTITNPTGLTAGAKDIYIKVKNAANTVSDALKIEIPACLKLTDITWKSTTSYTCGLELPSTSKMVTISVNSGYFTVPSLGSGTLTFLGGTNGSIYIDTFTSAQQFAGAVFSFTDNTAAQTLLSNIIYSTEGETPQTITTWSSTVSPQGNDIYFEGHFYRYVAGSIDWISAVLAAGSTVDPYFGGRGYIATATNQAENSILLKLTDTGGTTADHWYDAWMGGLWQRNTGTVSSPSITRGTDGNEISYQNLLSATAAQRQSMLLDYTIKYGNDISFINTTPEIIKYYWLDGPEAGQEIAFNTDDFSPWHSGEPNNGDFVYIGWEGAYWDDLSAYSGDNTANGFAKVTGYIVEFSGFDGGSTESVVQEDTKTTTADTTAPTLTAGAVSRTSDTTGTVKFTSGEAGQYYYAIVAAGTTAPTINATGTGITCNTGENTITNPIGLTAGAKDIYIKVKDAAGNVSAMLKIYIANFNTAPVFSGTNTKLTVDANSSENDIGALIGVSDSDVGQTLTWSQKTAPSHGTLGFSGATATSDGTSVQPGGSVTYTPSDNYAGTDSFTIQVSDGYATVERTITVTVVDRIAPTATINLGTHQWSSFISSVTYGIFFKNSVSFTITANDEGGSGIMTVQCLKSALSLTLEQLQTVTYWNNYVSSGYTIDAINGSKFIIYAKITDYAGNVTYINSDGMVFDLQAPAISTSYVKDATSIGVTVTDTGSGVGTVTYTINGGSTQTAVLSDGKFTISPLADGKYDVVITAKDTVGNESSQTVHIVSLHTVTFKLYEGDTGAPLKTQTVEYGSSATAPADPTRTGFTFKGWDKAFDNVTADITVNATWDISGITVTPYTETYDGTAHDAVTVTGTLSGDVITYSTNGSDYFATLPQITDTGSYPVYVKVSRTGYTDWTSTLNTAVITRASGSLSITSDPGKTYDGTTVSNPSISKTGDGIVSFTYYNDNENALGSQLSGAPTNAGTYWVKASLAQGTNYTAAEATFKFSIARASGSVSITSNPGKTYDGTAVSNPSISKTGDGIVSFTYYNDNENALGSQLSGAPTNAGTYWVKASLAQGTNYTAAEVTFKFSIDCAEIVGIVSIPNAILTGDTVSADVTGALPAAVTYSYQWSLDATPIEGAVSASYTVRSADYGKSLSVTLNATGNFCGSITSDGAVIGENIRPTAEITQGINHWNSFLNTVTLGLFFNDTVMISVKASDQGGSGIKSVAYYISSVQLTEQEVRTLSGWSEYTSVISLTPTDASQVIVYVKVTDNAGNVTVVSSDKMEFDLQSPLIFADYTKNASSIEATVIDGGSGVDTVTYTINGGNAQNAILSNGKFIISPLADGKYDVVITAKDLLGNESTKTIHVASVYTVTFKLDSAGTVLLKETIEYGSTAPAPALPTREGYTFKGWDKSLDKITGNIIFCATWEVAAPQSGTIGISGNSGTGSDVTAPSMGSSFPLYPLMVLGFCSLLAGAVIIRKKRIDISEE
ncbi:MAG TPA: InlB B-repeat-containing protein [Oscillospiraceae bacterium]|nr:InlB B-repeat-containing protein [Oscillospiraceae bacterium]HPK35475.1 InlB B-repeat-containing protein [Oscillospiraceae bacterium]HPR75199.1 InlB B-repeat-containing protein [Oscillospiraceae bacterium]